MVKDRRKQQLIDWLEQTTVPAQGELQVVSGDASFRRYFRYASPHGWLIAVDAPPPQESLQPFMAISSSYRAHGIRTPRVHAFHATAGFMVLDDLGDTLLGQRLVDEQAASALYQRALLQLPHIMRVTATELGPLPAYNRALLQRELDLFYDWLMGKHLGINLSAAEQQAWQDACEILIQNALQQPQVGVHRDYHSRNIMLGDDLAELGIIDFQDAVVGPITYDAVSLLRDCYIKWPGSLVTQGVDFLYQQLQAEQLLGSQTSLAEFHYWFDLMGIQRHLKAAGIFARLLHRDAKPSYMGDVPRTLSYVLEISKKYPALGAFSALISTVQHALNRTLPDA